MLKPELLALVVNSLTLIWYLTAPAYTTAKVEPGKILYWLGAVILTAGLMKMKG